jgi:hypothetical protein
MVFSGTLYDSLQDDSEWLLTLKRDINEAGQIVRFGGKNPDFQLQIEQGIEAALELEDMILTRRPVI